MAYNVEWTDRIRDYLFNLPLSTHAKNAAFTALHEIAHLADDFFTDPLNRAPRTSFLWRRLHLWDRDGDGHLHTIEFVIDDRDAVYGVLRVVYVEHTVGLPYRPRPLGP